MHDTIPLDPDRLREIAQEVPVSLFTGDGMLHLGEEEIAWLRCAPDTVRDLLAHLRWTESELDFYVTYCGALNRHIRAADELLVELRVGALLPDAFNRVRDALFPRDDVPQDEVLVRAHVPVGRGAPERTHGELPRTLLTRLTDGRVMCCICFEYVTRDQLNELPGGRLEDRCRACALVEADAPRTDAFEDFPATLRRFLADSKALDFLEEYGPGGGVVILALQSFLDRDGDGYVALAASRDEEDAAFEAAMRARRRDRE